MSELEMELEKCRSITGQLLESTNSVLSGPRIVQKREELSTTLSSTSFSSSISSAPESSVTFGSNSPSLSSTSASTSASTTTSTTTSTATSVTDAVDMRDKRASSDGVLKLSESQDGISYIADGGSSSSAYVTVNTRVIDFLDNLGEGNAEACIENVLSTMNTDDISANSEEASLINRRVFKDIEIGEMKLTESLEWFAQKEEEMKKILEDPSSIDLKEYSRTIQNDLQLFLESAGRGEEVGKEKETLGITGRSAYNFKSRKSAIDSLLLEFLTKASIGDEKMTAIVQKGLYDALLVDLCNESMIFEYLNKLLSTDDYLRYLYSTFTTFLSSSLINFLTPSFHPSFFLSFFIRLSYYFVPSVDYLCTVSCILSRIFLPSNI